MSRSMWGYISLYTREKTEEIRKNFKFSYPPKLEDCTVPVNAPIFVSKKCFFCQSTLRIYCEYKPYENVDLSLKNKHNNSLKNSNYENAGWNQHPDSPTGLWPFMEWNKLTSSSGVQTKTSSVDAILISCLKYAWSNRTPAEKNLLSRRLK